MDWIDAENGEVIKKTAIVGVGPVKTVKVTKGTKDNQVTTTIYNFTIRIGTGGVVVKSPDYPEESEAKIKRNEAMY